MYRDQIFAYVAMGPLKRRWWFAEIDDHGQPHPTEVVYEPLRRDLVCLNRYGFMKSLHRGYGCTSFHQIAKQVEGEG